MTENKGFQFDENFSFDRKKAVGTYTKVISLTADNVDSIVVTAFEGGVNYWCGVKRNEEFADKPSNVPMSTWITHCLLEGKEIVLYDKEETEDDVTLTLEKLLKGVSLNSEKRPHDSDLENMDADTADAIIQYAVFGKLVFG